MNFIETSFFTLVVLRLTLTDFVAVSLFLWGVLICRSITNIETIMQFHGTLFVPTENTNTESYSHSRTHIQCSEETVAKIIKQITCQAWVRGRLLAEISSSNPVEAWMSVSCECCMLSSIFLCNELITRPEESHRVGCVWMWSWSLDNEEAIAH
jgi:hypothetical protein